MTPHLTATLAGLGSGLALIIAIGAQNIFLLRQGIRREYVLPLVIICAVSDAVLIMLGVAGLGTVVTAVPWLVTLIRWAGAAFLLYYAFSAVRRIWRSEALVTQAGGKSMSLRVAILTCLALTWLNPHVYLDTVLLLGTLSTVHGPEGRWWFAGGAVAASVIWFSALGWGAGLLAPLFAKPRTWQILDGVIAVVMTALAVKLLLGS